VKTRETPTPLRLVNDGQEAELYLYGSIGWTIAAMDVVRLLAELTTSRLHVRINSDGGDVFEGVAIYNALRRVPFEVITHVDGMAASIASLVALAGSEVHMADNAFLMIHNASACTCGDAAYHLKRAELLQRVQDSTLAAAYVEKTGATPDQVTTWMQEETWFTAVEAEAAGFCDVIDETNTEAAAAIATLDISAYRRAPEPLRLAAAAHGPSVRTVEKSLRDAGLSRTKAAAGAAAVMQALRSPRDAGNEVAQGIGRLTTTLTRLTT
jgi:ATP-dependent Clp protease, protease subunit